MSVNVCFRDAAAYTVSVPPAGVLVEDEVVAESDPQPVSMTSRAAEMAPMIDWLRFTMQTLGDLR
jgi:glycine cleavage system aminomethyltransferase T